MNGDELIRKLRQVAKARGVRLEVSSGRGDHVKLRLGCLFTVLPGRKQEIRAGTLHAILKDLDLSKEDL